MGGTPVDPSQILDPTQWRKVILSAWFIAGCFSLMAVVISCRLIHNHHKHFTNPILQRKILGILWMVPIYAIDSWISLGFKDIAVGFDMFRDLYESYVLYLFFALMVSYLSDGDEEKVVLRLEQLPELQQPFPFGCCFPPVTLGREFLRDCKFGILQFVVVKPACTILAFLLYLFGLYEEGVFRLDRGYFWVSLVMNISITFAFYHLVLFYLATKDMLAPYRPIPKFLCIKAVLFFSFWQGVMLAGLREMHIIRTVGDWTSHNVTNGVQNFLICFEMFLASLAHKYAFPYEDFKVTDDGSGVHTNLLRDHLGLDDAIRDFNEVMPVVLPSNYAPSSAQVIDHSGESSLLPQEAERKSIGHGFGSSVYSSGSDL